MYRASTFSSTQERRLLEMAQEHIRFVLQTVRELRTAIDLWTNKADEELLEKANKVIELEEEANKVKKEFLDELSKASPSLMSKEDLQRLITSIDKIADKAVGASFFLTTLSGWTPPKDFEKKIKAFCDESFQCAENLRKAVFTLMNSPQKTIEITDEIDKGENKTDNLYREITVYTYEFNKDPFLAMKLKDLFWRIEEIADMSAEAAGTLRLISLSRTG